MLHLSNNVGDPMLTGYRRWQIQSLKRLNIHRNKDPTQATLNASQELDA